MELTFPTTAESHLNVRTQITLRTSSNDAANVAVGSFLPVGSPPETGRLVEHAKGRPSKRSGGMRHHQQLPFAPDLTIDPLGRKFSPALLSEHRLGSVDGGFLGVV